MTRWVRVRIRPAHLADGRIISVPLAWSWRLAAATPAQRANYEIIGDGLGVHWSDVDEDISAEWRDEEPIGRLRMGEPMIVSNPAVMMGKPVVAGTRITVDLILDKLGSGESIEQVLESHPRLTRGSIRGDVSA